MRELPADACHYLESRGRTVNQASALIGMMVTDGLGDVREGIVSAVALQDSAALPVPMGDPLTFIWQPRCPTLAGFAFPT